MYDWRKMTDAERQQVLATRRRTGLPWHSPPHFDRKIEHPYIVSAACYEHAPIIGKTLTRMGEYQEQLLDLCLASCTAIHAWCILPTHYHVLVQTARLSDLLAKLGQFHGRTSHKWNGEDNCRGRHTWYNAFDRPMLSDRHFWVSLNYVHHNPVKHGYVDRWQNWPFSSASQWLESVGRQKAETIWRSYPILDYGKDWDV